MGMVAGLGAQESRITGQVSDARLGTPVVNARVGLEGTAVATATDATGNFELRSEREGNFILAIEADEFESRRLPVALTDTLLALGTISLEPLPEPHSMDPIISLTEAELNGDDGSASFYGLLQADREVFLRRAAFDFSPVFFRLRGYDSRNTQVLLNGFPLNSLYDGRPQWNHWGGLNDVMRNQEVTYGLAPSPYTFGEPLGSLYMDSRPSGLRPGLRVSGSLSNRSYAGRLMATYTSAESEGRLQFALSGSRRWAREGYIEGTLYDAWSGFASLEYRLNTAHSLHAHLIMTTNRKGMSSALTEEMAGLLGSRYNPYWGWQQGEVRNSRVRELREPFLQLGYRYEGESTALELGAMIQRGTQARSRLGYYDAPNPDPVYYRYLPGYALNNPGGPNFLAAVQAREALLANPQLGWISLYRANKRGQAAYLLYEDVVENRQLRLQARAQINPGTRFRMEGGLHYASLEAENYSSIVDMLGAEFHLDMDPFSETRNDMERNAEKYAGDRFGYNFIHTAVQGRSFLQFQYLAPAWKAFFAGSWSATRYSREGLFRNERFPDRSLGKRELPGFSNFLWKAGVQYHMGGRHWWYLNALHGTRAPLLKHVFINPREQDTPVPGLTVEKADAMEAGYHLRLPWLQGRFGSFYTRLRDLSEIRFFFADGGLGSDFVQEVLTGLDYLYMGFELGLEFDLGPELKASTVASFGKYLYGSSPLVTINFDTAGPEEDLISKTGQVNLGPAALKDLRLASGPQHALSIGLDYRAPDYWWLGVTANYLASNHISPSALIRTKSFLLDPDTGKPFPDAEPEAIDTIWAQQTLEPVYLLNLTFGKSWLHKGRYMSVFASISNLFDRHFRTGGYEQSRNGNFGQWIQDNQSGAPSFGPKYWYGYGRTFFLNAAISF